MSEALLGRGIVDHNPPLSTRRFRRATDHWLTHWIVAFLGTFALTALFGWIDHKERAFETVAQAEERAIYVAEITRLQMRIADLESWECAQVNPERRLTPREYKWCQRERNGR